MLKINEKTLDILNMMAYTYKVLKCTPFLQYARRNYEIIFWKSTQYLPTN